MICMVLDLAQLEHLARVWPEAQDFRLARTEVENRNARSDPATFALSPRRLR